MSLHDNLDRLTSTTFGGLTNSFTWDALGRQLTETGQQGTVASQYDLAGRRTRLTWPDSFYVTYDYLLTDDMTAIRENGAASGVGVLASFTYDNLGRRTSLTRGNGVATAYAYDAASQLQSLSQDLASTAQDVTFTFTRNAAGQVLSRASSNGAYAPTMRSAAVSYTRNGLNQYTAVNAASLTYDGRGNQRPLSTLCGN